MLHKRTWLLIVKHIILVQSLVEKVFEKCKMSQPLEINLATIPKYVLIQIRRRFWLIPLPTLCFKLRCFPNLNFLTTKQYRLDCMHKMPQRPTLILFFTLIANKIKPCSKYKPTRIQFGGIYGC